MAAVDEILEKMRASREEMKRLIEGVTDEQVLLPVPAQNPPAMVRSIYYRLLSHEVEHTLQLIKTLNMLGAELSEGDKGLSEAKLALRESQMVHEKLIKLLQGLPDEILDKSPAQGEWSIREVVQHILDGERGFSRRIVGALKAAQVSGLLGQ